MIFVTVGKDFRNFDRLLKRMDEIAPRLPDEIVMQRGVSKYLPKNTTSFDFVPMTAAIEYIQNSRLVISHAGIGTIILCKQYGIPTLIIPRRKKYGEHFNDHQLEISKALKERGEENIYVIYEESQLEGKILQILERETVPSPSINRGKMNLIKTIKEFIERDE